MLASTMIAKWKVEQELQLYIMEESEQPNYVWPYDGFYLGEEEYFG